MDEGPHGLEFAGGGGPPGERNGQYRHGERTKAAIAERQRCGAIITTPILSGLHHRYVRM